MEDATPAYESLFNRGVAVAIDNGIWLGLTFYPLYYLPSSLVNNGLFLGIWFLAFASLWFNYFTVCEWRWGMTLGKRVMGIKVVNAEDGESPAFGPASIRNILRLVDFFLVGELMIANSERHQRLGDKAARTIVLRTRASHRPAAPAAPPAPAAVPARPASPTAEASGYAGLGRRTAAFLLDWVAFTGPWFILLGIAVNTWGDPGGNWVLAIGVVLWFNYFAVCEARFGQTIGKSALGIRVSFERQSGSRYASALWRSLLQTLDVWLIGPVLIASSEKHQRLGDIAAGSVVRRTGRA